MTATVPARQTTPAAWAKAWARQHPDYTGPLELVTITRKGKGGWGTTRRANVFYVQGGQAAARRVKRQGLGQLPGQYFPEHAYWLNGDCAVCGDWYLWPALTQALDTDGRALQRVCPKCIIANGLQIIDSAELGRRYYEARRDHHASPLARPFTAQPYVQIDTRACPPQETWVTYERAPG